MIKFTLEFFEYEPGRNYVEDYLNNEVSPELKMKIINQLELLETLGNTARAPLSKPLEDGIFECRVQQSNNIAEYCISFMWDKK